MWELVEFTALSHPPVSVDKIPILWYISMSKSVFDRVEKALKFSTFSTLWQLFTVRIQMVRKSTA